MLVWLEIECIPLQINTQERFQKIPEPSAGSRRRLDVPNKFAVVKRWGRVYFIAKKRRRPLFEGATAKIQYQSRNE